MKYFIVTLLLILFLSPELKAQEKKTEKPKVHVVVSPDTTVSREFMVRWLNAQKDAIQKQAEMSLARVQGQLDAFSIQKTDSVTVPKTIFQSQ